MSLRFGKELIADANDSNDVDTYSKDETDALLNTKADNTNVVHKTNNEDIDGTKAFIGNIVRRNDNIDYTIAPSSDVITAYYFKDMNNETYGACETVNLSSGNNVVRINIRGTNGSWSSCPITLGVDASGVTYTSAPTPSISSNDQNIVTTAYINNKFKVVSSLPSSPDSNTFYFVTE